MKLRDVIKESVKRVLAGKGSAEDKAIHTLLEHNKKYQEQIRKLKENQNTDLPVHQQTPWYLED